MFFTARGPTQSPLEDWQINALDYYNSIYNGGQFSPLQQLVRKEAAAQSIGPGALVATGVISGVCTFFVILATILAMRAHDRRKEARRKYEGSTTDSIAALSYPPSAAGTLRSMKSFKTNPVYEGDGDDSSLGSGSTSTTSGTPITRI